jgi:CheY-like chemotaxis protein
VADDDQNTRTLLKELLDPVVEKFTSVSNGETAIEERFDTCPHIILMDLEMPEMDGLEATELIREQERERNLSPVPIITQTAKAMKHVETRCLNAGTDAFMRKPINQRRLYRVFLDVMESDRTD